MLKDSKEFQKAYTDVVEFVSSFYNLDIADIRLEEVEEQDNNWINL